LAVCISFCDRSSDWPKGCLLVSAMRCWLYSACLKESAPELFLIGLAALELIGDASASSPVLVLVEDAQWLDDPSCAVLGFVARRVEAEQAVMLIAIRDGYETSFDDAGVPELRLQDSTRPPRVRSSMTMHPVSIQTCGSEFLRRRRAIRSHWSSCRSACRSRSSASEPCFDHSCR